MSTSFPAAPVWLETIPGLALRPTHCRTSSISLFRRIRHRDARTRDSVSGLPRCAVWSSVMVAASPQPVPVCGAEASARFACPYLHSSCGSVTRAAQNDTMKVTQTLSEGR